MRDFDYIICGSGSAGCVVAAELAQDPALNVLVIESGRRDRNPWIHIPATFFRVLRGGRDAVVHASQPEPGLGGRPCLVPQGHVVGGGSSVNAMIYIRG
jgi:choline dehydrogenase-like flavoprotein